MTESILYKKKYQIELRDVDFKNELKLSMLFSYCQETASLAASKLGVGINHLAEHGNIAWVLLKMRVEINRMPVINEEITIETWPQKPGKLDVERDFIVRDIDGDVLIRAVSVWALMDLKERKLKRTNSLSLQYPSIMEERAIIHKFKKLNTDDELMPVYEKTVGYSDIDFNGHLNNSRYINYVMDCFPLEEHRQFEIKIIEVHFIQEAFPGDTILLKKDHPLKDNASVFVEGTKKENDNPVFRAKMEVRKRMSS